MLRRVWRVAVLIGLLGTGIAWGGAALVRGFLPGQNSCYTIGYARDESWLIGALVYADGFFLAQYFPQNLTRDRGLFARLSPMKAWYRFSLRAMIPHVSNGRAARVLRFHLLPIVLLFAALSAHAWVVPAVRRRKRRRRGQCLACGYDLRGATSSLCSECGHANQYLEGTSH